jgi:divalent metal cation (Fe/Co/Zn/Cd) transporter
VEVTAALFGIIIAFTASTFQDTTGNTAYDAIGSLLIGLVLMVFPFFLARENKDLLIGEAMSRRDYKAIFNTVSKIPQVDKLISIRTMHLAPEDVIIAIEVSLIDDLNIDTIECLTDNIESKVKQVIPYAKSSKIYVVPNEPSNVDSGRKIFNNCGKKLLSF